ncbi:MAG TPA: hypothetical protein PLP17_13500, partial [Oligoflexia bacterium]|nr:hypothetical protein [Oligoflexia bacterium]
LWHPSRAYWSAKGINSPFADSVYALAQSLNQHVLGVFVLALLLAAPGLCCARLARRNEGCCAAFRKASPGLLVFAGIICALGFFPHTIDGILRYWMRGAGLAKVAHVSFGWTWPEPEFGYIGMILSRYPSVVTVLMFAGAAHGIYSARSLQRNNPRALWLLLLILSSIAAWVALLSISSKQAVRYLVPVSPLFSALAGYGLVALLELVSRNRRTCSSRVFAHAIHLLSTAVPLIIYFFSIRPLHPDYLFFYNSLSGGLSAARDRGLQLPTGGLSACLAVLEQEANRAGRRLQVALVADQDVVSAAYRRHYPNSHALQFVPGGKMRGADFVLVSESLVLMFREQLRLDFANLEPVYSYRVDGVDVTTVSRVLPGEFKEAAYLPLSGAHHHTGKLARLYKVLPETPPPVRPSDDALLADSQKHKAGYLFFGEMLKVSAGNYEFKFYLGLPAHLPVPGALPQTEVLRIEAGPKCERRLRLEELPP